MSPVLPCHVHPEHAAHAEHPASGNRRRIIKITAAGLAAPWALAAGLAHAKPAAGDRLVEEDAEGTPKPLRASDLRAGKPLLAFPFDATKGEVRSDSRLNKIVLMRFDESEMNAETKARSAGGVLAFSAICTHQGCDVKTWLAKERALVCFCHSSKFLLFEGGSVAGGPATRGLPLLPLSLDGDQLVIAGPFSTQPGGTA